MRRYFIEVLLLFLLSLLKCQLHDFLLLSHSILLLLLLLLFFWHNKISKRYFQKILKILLHHKVFCHFPQLLAVVCYHNFFYYLLPHLSHLLSTQMITKVPNFLYENCDANCHHSLSLFFPP